MMDLFGPNEPIDYEEVKHKEKVVARDRIVLTLLILDIALAIYVAIEIFWRFF